MKELLHRITLGVMLCIGGAAAADEAASRRLGDAAFYAGDFRNAISSYESSLAAADRSQNSEEWAAGALNLAIAYLRNGEISRSRQLLQEFRRRFPLRTTGTLEGDLLTAEGKYGEAEKFYKSMTVNDPSAEDARLFSLASLYMKMGGEEKIAQACDIFMMVAGLLPLQDQLRSTDGAAIQLAAGNNIAAYRKLGETLVRPDSPWQRYAAAEAAYALIRQRRIDESRKILAKIPASERSANVELLEYLADAYSGKIDKFKSNFKGFMEKLPPASDWRIAELCWMAATVAAKEKDHEFADLILTDSMMFAPNAEVRHYLERLQIEVQLHYLPAKAAASMKDYALNSSDPNRYRLTFDTAEKLFAAGNFQQTVELAEFLLAEKTQNVDVAETVRLGVFAAEKAKDFAALEKFNRQLFSNVALSDRVQFQQRYAAFLESSGKKEAAEKELREAFQSAKKSESVELIEKSALVLMEFYVRLDRQIGILEMGGILEKSSNAAVAAAAKCALGDLQERSFNYIKAREYFKAAAALSDNRYSPQAAFKAALMSYKESDFATAANEFFACAEKFPEYEKAPEALFMAADLFDPEKSAASVRQAEELLRKKYPSSQAFAIFVLRQASVKSRNSGEIPSLIADLQSVEKNFNDSIFAAEALLLRAVLTDKLGDHESAVKMLAQLYECKDKKLAAESFFRAGEIYFRRNQLAEAEKLFLRSAETEPDMLQKEIAILRAVDCDLAGKMPLDNAVLTQCIKLLDELSSNSKIARIRLEALCKKGIACEHRGDKSAALSAYEKVLYAAEDMVTQGLSPERIWCLKSCESALRLLVESAAADVRQQGFQLIKRCGKVVDDESMIQNMRENFRKQIKNRR